MAYIHCLQALDTFELLVRMSLLSAYRLAILLFHARRVPSKAKQSWSLFSCLVKVDKLLRNVYR